MRSIRDFNLKEFNSYKISSTCSVAHFPENEVDIVELFKRRTDYILIGSGHNIILSKTSYDQEFVIFNGNFDKIEIQNDHQIVAEAGASMLDLSIFALENQLVGLEIFYDIPSSLGGAVVMNAGASGEEIKDVLLKVRYLSLNDMSIKEIEKKDMGFEYRNSFFQRNTDNIILKAWVQLEKGDPEAIKGKMDLIKDQRWKKQPRDFPNAGSVFKRPKGYYVGAIMDDLGLKGYSCGGAKISEKHGGFIINHNEATGEDIISIINHVKSQVFNAYGVDLEVEQRII